MAKKIRLTHERDIAPMPTQSNTISNNTQQLYIWKKVDGEMVKGETYNWRYTDVNGRVIPILHGQIEWYADKAVVNSRDEVWSTDVNFEQLEYLSPISLPSNDAEQQRDNERYWERRCKAAENYIDNSPCDPDITSEQIIAHQNWQRVKTEILPAETNTLDKISIDANWILQRIKKMPYEQQLNILTQELYQYRSQQQQILKNT